MNNAQLIACYECDLLIELPEIKLKAAQQLRCPRCHHGISAGHDSPLDTVIALCITAVFTLVIACNYPFISFSAQGQSRAVTLVQTASELYSFGFPVLAFLVFSFILLLPFLYLLLLLSVLVPIKLNIRRSSPVLVGKLISWLLPWAMSEVFLIGVLVALIKVVAMAEISLGVSFWAYVAFVPMFIYVSSIVDRHRLWHWVEYGK